MIYRFLIWLKSFFSNATACQLCGSVENYADTAIIKIKHGNGAIFDIIICGACADRLEDNKARL